tara:strand:+ start:60 stop:197 length:138 start_codon:yes stop_codon:yes gene_type:complete
MAAQDAPSREKTSSGVSSDGISQSTYVFVYLLAMVLSVWIFVGFW